MTEFLILALLIGGAIGVPVGVISYDRGWHAGLKEGIATDWEPGDEYG